MTVCDETAGIILLAVSFILLFVPMSAIWLARANRRTLKREAGLTPASRASDSELAATRARLAAVEAYAEVSALERVAIVEMIGIVGRAERRRT